MNQIKLDELFLQLDKQHWNGELSSDGWHCCSIPMDEESYGYVIYRQRTINIAERLNGDPAELRRTLLHEMIHAHLHANGNRSHQKRNESHGAAFAAEIERLRTAGEDIAGEMDYVVCSNVSEDRLREAMQCYFDRQARVQHPDGYFDGAGRWYPSDRERQHCCSKVRAPSRNYPYNHMIHCRTIAHISRLHGVDTVALRDVIARASLGVCEKPTAR